MVESQLVVVGNQLLVVTVVGVDHREREREVRKQWLQRSQCFSRTSPQM